MKRSPIRFDVGNGPGGEWVVYDRGTPLASAPSHAEAVTTAISLVYEEARRRKEGPARYPNDH